jgi:ABC-2 type transport system permease protein
MIYRDIANLVRFPIDIYKEPIRSILTFIIPVGIMIAFPVKALLGLISPMGVVWSFIFGVGIFLFSVRIWKFALTKYTSASS